jgi:hypothetical protein
LRKPQFTDLSDASKSSQITDELIRVCSRRSGSGAPCDNSILLPHIFRTDETSAGHHEPNLHSSR